MLRTLRNLAGLVRYRSNLVWPALRRVRLGSLSAFLVAFRQEGRSGGRSRVRLRGSAHDFIIRHGTSDFAAFCQVLLLDGYAGARAQPPVRRILDGGANVGYASRYFLDRFVEATVLAVEPDAGNVAAARENLAPYADRCVILHAALWSHEGQVTPVAGHFRDGREWAVRVEERRTPSGTEVEAISIPTALRRSGWDSLDLLKLDIEGAERELFADEAAFMKDVRCCFIELHDAEATEQFERVCRTYGFSWMQQGETTVAWHPDSR